MRKARYFNWLLPSLTMLLFFGFVSFPKLSEAANFSINVSTPGNSPVNGDSVIAPGQSLDIQWQIWWVGSTPSFPLNCTSSHFGNFVVNDNANHFLQETVTVNPAVSTTYTLECAGSDGQKVSNFRTVVVSSVPIVSVSPAVSSLSAPGVVVVGWQVGAATSCTPSGGGTSNWTSITSMQTGGVLPFTISSSTTFTLTCSNGNGASASDSKTVTVGGSSCNNNGITDPGEACDLGTGNGNCPSQCSTSCTANTCSSVSLAMSASPNPLVYGGSTTLSWTVTGTATSCVTGGGWSGGNPGTGYFTDPANGISGSNGVSPWSGSSVVIKPQSGSYVATNVTSNTTYTIECFDGAGLSSGQKQVTVTMDLGPDAAVSFVASPSQIIEGQSTKLVWQSDAAYCTAYSEDGSFSGQQAASGSWDTPALMSSKNYYLNCTSATGVTVPFGASFFHAPIGYVYTTTVKVVKQPPLLTFKAEPASIHLGETSTLKITAANAVACLLNYVSPQGAVITLWSETFQDQNGIHVHEEAVSPSKSTEYQLVCQSPQGGELIQKAYVGIIGENPPSGGPETPPNANTSCSVGTCKAACNTATESQNGTCNNNQGFCCAAKVATPPVLVLGSFKNPLSFNTVEDVLNSVWGFLQGVIVILSLIMIVIGAIVYMTAAGNDSKLSTGKLIITAALVGLALALAAPSFLKQIGDILGWSGTNGASVATAKTLLEILQSVLNFLLSVVGIIAIIMLVIGGLMYLTAAGDEDRIGTGKKIVQYSLIGIAVSLAALVIVTQVVAFFN